MQLPLSLTSESLERGLRGLRGGNPGLRVVRSSWDRGRTVLSRPEKGRGHRDLVALAPAPGAPGWDLQGDRTSHRGSRFVLPQPVLPRSKQAHCSDSSHSNVSLTSKLLLPLHSPRPGTGPALTGKSAKGARLCHFRSWRDSLRIRIPSQGGQPGLEPISSQARTLATDPAFSDASPSTS